MEPNLIRARAPLRISFAGGTTDMPSYYEEHGGAVLVSAINRYASVAVTPACGDEIVVRSMDFDLTVKYHVDEEPLYDGVLDIAKAAVRRLCTGERLVGMDILLESDAPAGSGLGGSAALTAAIVGALCELLNIRLDPYQLAETAYTVERLDLGISGGKQDQYAVVFGGFNLIEFSRSGVVVTPLRIPRHALSDLESHLMLCYTGRTRFSAGLIDAQERSYRAGRPKTLEGLQRLRELAYEMKDALLTNRLDNFAAMLNEAWERKIATNPHVTDPSIDAMYCAARQAGALGGKLLGAGGGGYLLLFCRQDRKRAVRERLEAMGGQFADFSFVDDGLYLWRSSCR